MLQLFSFFIGIFHEKRLLCECPKQHCFGPTGSENPWILYMLSQIKPLISHILIHFINKLYIVLKYFSISDTNYGKFFDWRLDNGDDCHQGFKLD